MISANNSWGQKSYLLCKGHPGASPPRTSACNEQTDPQNPENLIAGERIPSAFRGKPGDEEPCP